MQRILEPDREHHYEIEALADDLASLTLHVMTASEGYARPGGNLMMWLDELAS